MAYDSESGRELWSADVQNSGVGGPVTYQVGDEQFVAMALGRGAATLMTGPVPRPKGVPHANRVVAFKLDGAIKLPEYSFTEQVLRSPPEMAVDREAAEIGRYAYHRFCFGCHGREARGNRIQPDLRYSPYLDNGLWQDVVTEGSLADLGMVSFGEVVTPELAESIRSYVILEAQNAAAGAAN
jgi:mono/diheme cytochrome c family protein